MIRSHTSTRSPVDSASRAAAANNYCDGVQDLLREAKGGATAALASAL